MGKTINLLAMLGLAMLLSGCGATLPPLKTVDHVDIPRFMGDWYVIACIPTFIEKGAYNAVESYRLDPDGTIADYKFDFDSALRKR